MVEINRKWQPKEKTCEDCKKSFIANTPYTAIRCRKCQNIYAKKRAKELAIAKKSCK